MTDAILRYRDDEILLRDSCRAVLQGDFPTSWVRSVMDTDGPWRQQRSRFAELGWTALALPESHGGLGFGLRELAVVAEEFGRAVQPGAFLSSSVAGLAIAEFGDLADGSVAGRWLTELASGDVGATWSTDVDGAAGPLTAIRDPKQPERWQISGARRLIPDLAQASMLLIDALDDDGQTRLFAVPTDAHGMKTQPHVTADLGRRYRHVQFGEVPGELVTDDPEAVRWLTDAGTVIQCAESLGAAERLLEMTVAFAQQRHQFGRAIGTFQAIKHRIADMRIRVQAGRAAMRYAAWSVAGHRADASRAVHVAKQWIGESSSWVASEALQIHGGIGFTWEHDLHLYLRRLKANELTLGTPDWHSQRLGEWCLCGQ